MLFLNLIFLSSALALSPTLFVDEVDTLLSVESQGYSFAQQMGSKDAETLAKLATDNDGYRLIVESLTQDLKALASENRGLGAGMKFSYRLFDAGWLRSKKSKYELAGITFRSDQKFRHPTGCGEIRLIYRLAYRDEKTDTYSRLPMTIQHVRTLKPPCQQRIETWNPNSKALLAMLENSDPFDVELNLQSVRWPSAMRPDMGGYAEYIMRVFEHRQGRWRTKLLHNTPDVEKINRDPKIKKELLAWLKDPGSIDLIDRGEAVLASRFLTSKGTSIAVHGLNRRANRLFSQIFREKDFADLDYSKWAHVKSARGYLQKMDEMTCIGCHQSKSIAGFHFLGKDRPGSIAFNTVTLPFSNHFWMDQKRRSAALTQPGHSALGFVDRPDFVRGEKNERCYAGTDKSFSHWTCVSGLKCEPVGSAVGPEYFGTCQEAGLGLAGDACYFGRINQNKNPKKESEVQPKSKACAAGLGCLHPSDGYPGGLCFANFCEPSSAKTCGALAVPGFNPCLAQGKPFKECLARFTGSIEAGGCALGRLCRDDFICAEGFAGKGVCVPPYSLFQLRVDGHPEP